MHELSIAHAIISAATKTAAENGNPAVTAIDLQIGTLSGIETDSLQFAFSVAKADTALEHATLNIEMIPGEACCITCDRSFHLDRYDQVCPYCQGIEKKIVKGREMRILNITVEE